MVLAALTTWRAPPVIAEVDPPEVIYRGGSVITVDGHGTVAQAIGIAAGRIIYVGIRGLIDGHMHPVAAGVDLLKCNLHAWCCETNTAKTL